jgi:hypothetical protein
MLTSQKESQSLSIQESMMRIVLAIIALLAIGFVATGGNNPKSANQNSSAEQPRVISPVANADDQLNELLKTRKTMVAAVAIILSVPPKCTVDNKSPDGEDIARFIMSYGHDARDIDGFSGDVKRQMDGNERSYNALTDETTKKQVLEMTCGLGVLYTMKVKQANK